MTDRPAYPTRKLRLGDLEPDDRAHLDAAGRFEMVWELALAAWAFKGLDHEPRHVVRPTPSKAEACLGGPGHVGQFDEAWGRRNTVQLWGLAVPVVGREDLIRSKRAAGRERDVADVAELERER
jgi:hypothetical protein